MRRIMSTICDAIAKAWYRWIEMNEPQKVPSPCIGLCVLDEAQVCRGCGRTPEEIGAWGSMDNVERRAVLSRVELRRGQNRAD